MEVSLRRNFAGASFSSLQVDVQSEYAKDREVRGEPTNSEVSMHRVISPYVNE